MLEKLIQRSSQRRLLIGLLLTLFLLEVGVLNARYFYNLIAGPFPMTTPEIAAILNPDDQLRYRVTLQGNQVDDTGYEYFASEGGAVVYSYAVLSLGDRRLLVEFDGRVRDQLPRRVTGQLVAIPEAVRAQVLDPIFAADPEQRALFLPSMLYACDFVRSSYLGLIALIAALILSGGLLLTGWRRLMNPASHPAARALRPCGDPLTAARQIEKDLHSVHPTLGNLHFMGDWLVYFSPSALEAIPFKDIIWTYKQTAQQRSDSAAVGKTTRVYIHSRYGMIMAHSAPESQANEMLAMIARRAPQALTGDRPDWQRQWRFDRTALIAASDARRSALAAEPVSDAITGV